MKMLADGSAVFCPVGAVLAGTYFHRDFGPDVAGVGVGAMTYGGRVDGVTIGQEREQSTPSTRLPARAVRTPIGRPVENPKTNCSVICRFGVNSPSAA
jgi:hypothetical protein